VAEQRGFLTAMAEPVAEAMARHQASSPRDKNFTRAGGGVFLLVCCAYTAVWSPVFLGGSFDALTAAFLRAPTHPPVGLMIWAGIAAFGLLWLWVGVRGARGPRDIMAAFWAAVRVVLFGCALGLQWYLPRDWGDLVPLANLVLHGLYLGLLAEGVVHFLLAMRGIPGDARRNVRQHIEQNEVVWRSARRK
jgi:hypothetical protein